MQVDAKGAEGPAISGIPQMLTDTKISQIDVTAMAQRAMFAGHVAMDAEAFGVAVTRRPGAAVNNLSSDEQSRLLDVLVHARAVQAECDEDGREFSMWVVSSDTRDHRARAIWMTMCKVDIGSYAISLSDA